MARPQAPSVLPVDDSALGLEAPLNSEAEGTPLRARAGGAAGLRWRLVAGVVAALTFLGVASLTSLHGHQLALSRVDALSTEQKFYDGSGAYWQAPERGISSSELWGSCNHLHMRQCGSYCCCDKEYYWKSSKTVYQQAKNMYTNATVGTTVKQARSGSAVAAAGTVKDAVEALGKAAFASLLSEGGQECTPRAKVPREVVEALADGDQIPGSDEWATCSTFTANSHTCGSFCCCNGGRKWDMSSKACVPK